MAIHHHLLIGGTGRAGTSFLVRYLAAAGLDTTLSRELETAFWDNNANAGLEEFPRGEDFDQMPYVIKTPWLYEVIEKALQDADIRIDAVIIPVRRLQEAASSRVIVELRNLYQFAPWMTKRDRPFANWSTTAAGGCLTSLDLVDQARLLATGFHLLIERLVEHDIPIVFLSFPRLAQDPDYLFDKLSRFLPALTRAQAQALHTQLADPQKIRVAAELPQAGPTPEILQLAAMRRELARCQNELAAARRRARTLNGLRSLASRALPLRLRLRAIGWLTSPGRNLKLILSKSINTFAAWKTAGS